MEQMRINKFLSDVGFCSRRSADELVKNGRVKVNSVLAVTGQKIDPSKDKIFVDDKEISRADEKIYYALYKPKGIVSTVQDEKNRKSVVDLVPRSPRVYPVGRLDRESEGLLILTNDGELTNLLTHPRNEHVKRYEVLVRSDKTLEISAIEERFVRGVKIKEVKMSADRAQASVVNPLKKLYKLKLELHTGYNHQIRKMCAKMGLEVLGLKRTDIAKLSLEELGLEAGGYKKVIREQII